MGGDEAFEVVRREHYALALLAAANIDVPNVADPDVGAQRLHGHAEAAGGLGGGQEQALGVGQHRLAAALRARQGGERKGPLHRVAILGESEPKDRLHANSVSSERASPCSLPGAAADWRPATGEIAQRYVWGG
jgi:hypothetical protein